MTDTTPSLDDAERAALVALASLPGIGPATLAACRLVPGPSAAWSAVRRGRATAVPALAALARHPRAAMDAATWAHAAAEIDPAELLEAHRLDGQRVVVAGDAEFPARLEDDPSPPPLLFLRGAAGCLDGPTVAIVGTRSATRVGCETAGALAEELAARGVAVVSGLALGIDGAAHRAVVGLHEHQRTPGTGRPVGVVAAGLDRSYPRRHRALHAQVAELGVVLGETPLGGAPLRWRFPARNRIIAGLADAVVVVESRSAGGSMLTASEALARGIPVLAVPAHPRAPAGAGALDLIADGAAPVRDVDDVLVAIGAGGRRRMGGPGPRDRAPAPSPTADPVARELLATLAPRAATLHDLVVASGRSLGSVAAALVALEDAGAVARRGPWYELVDPAAVPVLDGRP